MSGVRWVGDTQSSETKARTGLRNREADLVDRKRKQKTEDRKARALPRPMKKVEGGVWQ